MKMKIILLFAIIFCAYAAEESEKKNEANIMEMKDKRQTQDEAQPGVTNRTPRKQEQAAPVMESQEEDKTPGRADAQEYRPGQVISLNAQELMELQPERKAPLASNQQLQQLYANPQPENSQNLQPFYYLDPQISGQVSLQPSHTVIARPHFSLNGGEASVGAALSVSDTGSPSTNPFDQELLALLNHAARQEEQQPQAYLQPHPALQISQPNIPQQYQQVDRYVAKPSKKPTKLRPKVQILPTQPSTAPQQYLIETTNVQSQQQSQYGSAQPQRTAQTLRYFPSPSPQAALQQVIYERPESQGLKIVPAPNLQNLVQQSHNQPNFVFVPQYQPTQASSPQYQFVDTQRQTIQPVRHEEPRISITNVERPLAYLKRFPEQEKMRAVKIYNPALPEGLASAPQPTQLIGEQYYLRPVQYRQNEQRSRYELSPQLLRPLEQHRSIDSTKPPHSAIYVNKNIAPKKVARPLLRADQSITLEQPTREQSYRVEQPASSEQISVQQHGRSLDEQRANLPPPKNNKAYTPEEFAALVAAGYSVTPVPVGHLGQQAAQARSTVEAVPSQPQRRPLYSKRHQYLPLRIDDAP